MTTPARPRAVVCGTGFGVRVHVPALRAAGFDVGALVGRDRDRTARRAARCGVPGVYGSLSEALDLDDLAVVTVATPPDTHAPLVFEAVAAGCHVLCEKPFAMDAGEAAAMLDAASRAGVVHLVGHEFRFAEDRAVAARAIHAGAAGAPRLAVFAQVVPLAADPATPAPRWWFDRDRGGGWLGASGSHVVDQARHWLGEIEWVAAALPTVGARPADAAEDSFAVLAGFAGGCVATLVQSAAAWGPPAGLTRVCGDAGTVYLDGGQAWVADADGARPLPVPADLALPPAPSVDDDPRHRFTHLELGPYTRLCERFAAAMAGGSAGDAATFADGLATQRVLDAIRTSARHGEIAFVDRQ